MSLNDVIDEINNLEHFHFYQCSACGQKVHFHILQIKSICPKCGAESKVRGYGSIGSEIQDVIDAVLEWAGKDQEFEAVMSRYRSIVNDKYQENNHSYYVEFRRQLDKFHQGLSTDITLTTTLPTETKHAVVSYLLELACQSQNILNIEIGRKALLDLPKEWLIANIEPMAKPLLLLENEWEYRRLMEVYRLLDRKLADGLIKFGINSKNPDICEAALDYKER